MHTVSFDLNYNGEALESQSVKDGQYATVPAMPKRSGYTFTGWFTDKKLNSKYNFEKPVTEDITLYAHWSKSGGTVGTSISVPTNRTNTDTDGMTVGDIIATADDFLVLELTSDSKYGIKRLTWSAGDEYICYAYKNACIAFEFIKRLENVSFTVPYSAPVTKSGDNYVINNVLPNMASSTVTFNMESNTLKSISLSGFTAEPHDVFDGKEFTAPEAMLNGIAIVSDYTYDATTGTFSTTPGFVRVPAATYAQDPETGKYTVTPGEVTITFTDSSTMLPG